MDRSTRHRAGRSLLLVGVLLGAGPTLARDEPQAGPAKPVLMAQRGHGGPIVSAAFSPDGRQVLTASWDNTACLWETATGKEVRRFEVRRREGDFGWVNSAAFSPDGTQVLTAIWDHSVRLWETATGREVRRFLGHTGRVNSAVFSSDGTQVLTASEDQTARLWEAATGKEVRRFVGHAGTGQGIDAGLTAVFSTDGAQVLTASEDRTARLWAIATGKEVLRFEGHAEPVSSATFSPDGTQVLTASQDGLVLLWETATAKQVRRFAGHGLPVYSAVFSSDGKRVLTAGYDKTARLWETATGSVVRRFEGHGLAVYSAAFSPDGTQVLTASHDETARVWEADTGKERLRLEGRVKGVNSATFSTDGTRLLTAGYDKTAHLWDTATGREVARLQGHAEVIWSAVPSPDGTQVLAASGTVAVLWNAPTGTEMRRLEGHADGVESAVFSPDGTQVLTASRDGTARLWEAATGKEARRFEGHAGGVERAVFSSDGRQILTASLDGTARVWDPVTGAVVRRFEGHAGGVVSAVFSPDDRQVLTASWDGTVRLWDTATAPEVRRFAGHTNHVASAVFAGDGTRVLTASWDGTVRLWETATGRELCSLISFLDGSWAVTDPQGRFDASHGGDVEGLHWVVGLDVISLDQLKERYYEPGLLGKHLGRDAEPLREVGAFTAPRLYPEVTATEQGGRLRIALANRGGGIGKVVILVNGKERTADARGPGADPHAQALAIDADLTDDPRLLPGAPNTIEVFAYNEEGWLRSRGVELAYAVVGQKQDPSLWAVIAGVSDYRGHALDLRFAAKDATDFAAALTLAGKALFGEARTHVRLLTDAAADRKALDEALGAAREAKAGDVLVVYLAGHGVSLGDGFYYLTAEAQSADLSDPALRAATALSSAELSAAINAVPALKQVLVLDTCASGRLIEDLTSKRAVPSSQVRALDRLKDRTGMYVLAGCAADRVSYEATQYGQGLLTYSLLLGMKGGQLREGEYVDVSTLFNFAADKVPELAKDIGGVQRPIVAAPRAGSSFDIGRLTEEDQRKVPLNAVRPLFVRTSLQDDEERADLLDLSEQVNERLGELSAQGGKAALVFVDAPAFPGAYRIAGGYSTREGLTTVRFKLRRDKEALTDWIEVSANSEALPALLVEAARARVR